MGDTLDILNTLNEEEKCFVEENKSKSDEWLADQIAENRMHKHMEFKPVSESVFRSYCKDFLLFISLLDEKLLELNLIHKDTSTIFDELNRKINIAYRTVDNKQVIKRLGDYGLDHFINGEDNIAYKKYRYCFYQNTSDYLETGLHPDVILATTYKIIGKEQLVFTLCSRVFSEKMNDKAKYSISIKFFTPYNVEVIGKLGSDKEDLIDTFIEENIVSIIFNLL